MGLVEAMIRTKEQLAELRKVLPAALDHRVSIQTDGDGNIVGFQVLPDTIQKRPEFE